MPLSKCKVNMDYTLIYFFQNKNRNLKVKKIIWIFFIVLLGVDSAYPNQSLTPAQLQMIKQAGYGNYLEQLKRDASKSINDDINYQSIENNISITKRPSEIVSNMQDKQTILFQDRNSSEDIFDFLEQNNSIINDKKTLIRYGSSFFDNKNTINPYSIPTPDSYILTKGDKLSITVYGIDNGHFMSRIDRDGSLTIDRVGRVVLAGVSFETAKKVIKSKIRQAFPTATDIVITISEFTPIQVVLSGLVKAPGLYNLTSFSTIKDALMQSGGILPNGSYRNIVLKRSGKVIKVFDLYRLIRYGDDSSDVMLQNGDILIVKPIKKSIKLFGSVNMPAIYELKDDENFITLISLASGLKPNADQHNIRLKRYKKNREIKVLSISLSQLYKINPKNGDEVTVFDISPQMAKSVIFEGNVAINGEVELPKDHRLSSLFKKVLHKFGKKGFFKFNTNYSFGLVIYGDHIKSFNLSNVLKGYEDLRLYGGEKIHIFKRNDLQKNEYIYAVGDLVDSVKREYAFINGMSVRDLFHIVQFKRIQDGTIVSPSFKVKITRVEKDKEKIYTIDSIKKPNFKLKPFDKVEFFDINAITDQNQATINGEVFIPGNYSFKGKYITIGKLIKLAGGLTKKALLSNCEIARYKIQGDERIREVFNVNLKDIIKSNYKIYPDDEVKIFPISNWRDKKYITLRGEVKYPGRYAINSGEKLASVIKRAGGFTKNAFIEGAIFTRENVKKLQEEQIKESLDKLKNRAIALQSEGANIGEDKDAKQRMLLSIKELEKKANELKPIGRISMHLYLDLDRFENSPYNITLKDGDKLYIPQMTDTVTVIGQVLNQNTFIYEPDLTANDYIEKAGGLNQSADDEHIYIVKANGEAFRYQRSFFKVDKEIFKGDTIVVPMKLDAISNLQFSKDVSDILYKLAVTAASLKTVGAL